MFQARYPSVMGVVLGGGSVLCTVGISNSMPDLHLPAPTPPGVTTKTVYRHYQLPPGGREDKMSWVRTTGLHGSNISKYIYIFTLHFTRLGVSLWIRCMKMAEHLESCLNKFYLEIILQSLQKQWKAPMNWIPHYIIRQMATTVVVVLYSWKNIRFFF